MIETFAPAKINLYLHVTGRREDGYHFLDSLVVFANIGDTLRYEPEGPFSFTIEGRMAAELAGFDPESNLVVRAARMLAAALNKPLTGKLSLVKNLPIASGIGGGSTDAAGTLRLLATHYGLAPDAALLQDIAKSLGQDIPCCIMARTCCFKGIGDVTVAGPELPLTHMVLVNPNQSLSTPAVFKNRKGGFTPAAPLETSPATIDDLVSQLRARENTLTASAIELCPDISIVLEEIEKQEDCLLSRMSGSGATCFGLFADRSTAKRAAATLYESHPDWWVVPAFFPASLAPA